MIKLLLMLLLLLLLAFPCSAAKPAFQIRIRAAHGETTLSLPPERYVASVLAGESSVFQSEAALKAMAVAVRTYAMRLRGRHSREGYDFCATTHCQRLDLGSITPRLEAIATNTAAELLWFEGKLAFTPYTRDCGGRTEDAGSVWPDVAAPYLKSHDDPYCIRAGSYQWQWNADPQQIADALYRSQLRAPRQLEAVGIAQRTASGRALNLVLTGGGESVPINAGSFRFAIGRELGWNTVFSGQYEVHSTNGSLIFQGYGAGHGVGLCQHGADQMGTEGRSYREILSFYYPGTVAGVTARGISWQWLGGETISLLTTQPQQDRVVLWTAERLLRVLSERTSWPAPTNTEIRVYPDLDTYRNATGEPGWVAAHTAGRRIHLQPAALLRARDALQRTLRHELLHVLVESQAVPELPTWFREGLVAFLEDRAARIGTVRVPLDSDLRQTTDAARARRAYSAATRAVTDLVNRYGEGAVLDWVKRGLPDEVKNTSSSQARTKSE